MSDDFDYNDFMSDGTEYEPDSNTRKWTCKDGKVIAIRDMETQHLENVICMLERYTNLPSIYYKMKKELLRRKNKNRI